MASLQQSPVAQRSHANSVTHPDAFYLAQFPSVPPAGASAADYHAYNEACRLWVPGSLATPPVVLATPSPPPTTPNSPISSAPPVAAPPRRCNPQKPVTIAVDTEALLRTDDPQKGWRAHGAMALVKKLLRINGATRDGGPKVEVVLMCHATGPQRRRVVAGLREAELPVDRMLFVRPGIVHKLLKPCEAMLYLSCNPKHIADAVGQGVAAGCILPQDDEGPVDTTPQVLQLAFDFDGVLADDASQQRFESDGLQTFHDYEERHRNTPMGAGPALPLALAMANIRDALRAGQREVPFDISISVITARGSVANERLLCTFETWGLHPDDIYCLSGTDKTPLISELHSDLYIDDNPRHADRAKNVTLSVHMPTLTSLGAA